MIKLMIKQKKVEWDIMMTYLSLNKFCNELSEEALEGCHKNFYIFRILEKIYLTIS